MMKQFILTIFILLRTLQSANAQQMMVITGFSVSRNTGGGGGEETVSGNMLAGYRIGFTTNIPLRKAGCCSLQTGMLLNEWGSIFQEGSDGQNAGQNGIDDEAPSNKALRFRYIELPLLLSNRFWLSPFTSIQLGAGPYIACRVNSPSQAFLLEQAGNHYMGALYPVSGTEYRYERLDYGLSFSGGLDIQGKFNISLQYDHGLRNIIGCGNDITLRNQAISLSLGYYLKPLVSRLNYQIFN